MNKEERDLLWNVLCEQLPYGLIADSPNPAGGAWDEIINVDIFTKTVTLLYNGRVFSIDDIKPYLRPMSSMTDEEWLAYCDASLEDEKSWVMAGKGRRFTSIQHQEDFLNSHHFDYRGLIEKGLALEAPEDMYKEE